MLKTIFYDGIQKPGTNGLESIKKENDIICTLHIKFVWTYTTLYIVHYIGKLKITLYIIQCNYTKTYL